MNFKSLAVLLLFLVAHVSANDWDDRQKLQSEYDQICEAARSEKLAVEKVALIEECVNNESWTKDREQCERFYRDYGGAISNGSGVAPAKYYDLPECLKAFDYKKSYRQ